MTAHDPDPPVDWFAELIQIVARLRAPDGCPWDRKQTHQSLRRYLVEEVAEFLEALDHDDRPAMADELGDILLQIALHSQIAAESGDFTAHDVARLICEKMVRRHPHVFGDAEVDNAEQVIRQWDRIKQEERRQRSNSSETPSLLAGVPSHLPSLHRAHQVQRKAAKVGFDWPHVDGVLEKVREELGEVQEALARNDRDAVAEELGDLLFAVCNLTRFCGHFGEDLLHQAVRKFEQRFGAMEQALREQDRNVEDCSLDDLEHLWQQAKQRPDPGGGQH